MSMSIQTISATAVRGWCRPGRAGVGAREERVTAVKARPAEPQQAGPGAMNMSLFRMDLSRSLFRRGPMTRRR